MKICALRPKFFWKITFFWWNLWFLVIFYYLLIIKSSTKIKKNWYECFMRNRTLSALHMFLLLRVWQTFGLVFRHVEWKTLVSCCGFEFASEHSQFFVWLIGQVIDRHGVCQAFAVQRVNVSVENQKFCLKYFFKYKTKSYNFTVIKP